MKIKLNKKINLTFKKCITKRCGVIFKIRKLFDWTDSFLFKLPIIGRRLYLRQLMKFSIVGGISAAINFLLLYSLTEWLKIWYLFSAILGFIAAAIFNFLVNKFWTFHRLERGKGAFNQLWKFSAISVSGLIINTLVIYFLTEFIKFDYRLSWVFACAVVTSWNFCFNKLWIFK